MESTFREPQRILLWEENPGSDAQGHSCSIGPGPRKDWGLLWVLSRSLSTPKAVLCHSAPPTATFKGHLPPTGPGSLWKARKEEEEALLCLCKSALGYLRPLSWPPGVLHNLPPRVEPSRDVTCDHFPLVSHRGGLPASHCSLKRSLLVALVFWGQSEQGVCSLRRSIPFSFALPSGKMLSYFFGYLVTCIGMSLT